MSARIEVDEVLGRLEKIAATIEVPYQHWLGGADQGPSYCFDCATKKVEAGDAEFVDGGWQQEDDTCRHCEDCGRLLEYSLTNEGVESELEHFTGARFDRVIGPELAYHLARVLEQHEYHPAVLKILPKVGRALVKFGGAA